MIQIIIFITGAAGIYLSQQPDESLKRYACFFGIAGQPFWMITSYQNEQYGIFAMSFIYLAAWSMGLYNYWLNPQERRKPMPCGKGYKKKRGGGRKKK